MSNLQLVIDSIHLLDPAEKVAVRSFLDQELAPGAERGSAATAAESLIGLLADAPELADHICESAMRDRESRPLRLAHE